MIEEGKYKVYFLDILARLLMTEKNEKGTIQAAHLREAHRRLTAKNVDDRFVESDLLYF